MRAALVVATGALVAASCASGSGGRHEATSPRSTGSTRPVSSSASTTAPPTVTAPRGLAAQPTVVNVVHLDLVDRSRPEVTHGRPVAPARSLPTDVYVPAEDAQHRTGAPLPWVVFLHGYGLDPQHYRELLGAWASAGIAVAAPTLPLTSSASGANLDESDMVNEPGDVSFLITSLLAQSRSPGSPLSGRLDGRRIGLAGHSDGADVAFVAGFGNTKRDRRVQAVLDLSGELPVGNDTFDPSRSGPPLLILLGDHDEYVPLASARQAYDAACCRKTLAVLPGATHLPPFAGPTPWSPAVDRLTTDFLLANLAGDRAAAARLAADEHVPGLVEVMAQQG